MASKKLWERALEAIEASKAPLAGAVDETLFGLPDKYIPGHAEISKKYPKLSTAGRVGSYFIPGTGWVKLATKVPKAGKLVAKGVQMASGAAEGAKKLPAIAKFLEAIRKGEGYIDGMRGFSGLAAKTGRGVAKGAAGGAAQGEAQHAVRKILGTEGENPSSDFDRVANEATGGVLGRGFGAAFNKLAPAIYNHPALLNKYKLQQSKGQANELMKEGVFGSLDGAFTNRADELRAGIDEFRKRISPGLRRAERTETMRQLVNQPWNKGGMHLIPVRPKGIVKTSRVRGKDYRDEIERMQQSGTNAETISKFEQGIRQAENVGLKPDFYGRTNVPTLERAMHNANKTIAKQSGATRGKVFGDGGQGEVADELDRALNLRRSYTDMYKEALDQIGPPGALQEYMKHVPQYRRGADLQENILSFERGAHGNPVWIPSGAVRQAAHMSIASAPVRTFSGVVLDRAAPRMQSVMSRSAELSSRTGGDPATAPAKNPFLKDDPELNPFLDEEIKGSPPAEPGRTGASVSEEARAASARRMALSNPDILAAIDDPTDEKKNAAGQKAHAKVAPRLYGKKKKEENPFLDDDLEE